MKRIIIALCAVSMLLNTSVKAEETKVVPEKLSVGIQEASTATLEDNENEKPKTKKKTVKKTKKHKKAKKQ